MIGGLRAVLLDLALPRTDAGVLVQLVVWCVTFPIAMWASWRHGPDIRRFVAGLFIITLAYFGLRTLH